MLSPRRRVLGSTLLVVGTAIASTGVAIHRSQAADARAASAARASVRLEVVPSDDAGEPPPSFDRSADPVFALRIRNAGSAGVVIRSAAWRQRDVAVDLAVDPGQDQSLVLPQPTGCPTHRVTEPLAHLDVRVATGGAQRTVRLALPDPLAPAQEINTRCGLHAAAESVQAGVGAVRARPGEVVLDLSMTFSGVLPTQVLGVRSAAGLDTSVAERLPVQLPPGGDTLDARALPHVLTVTLRLRDCRALVPSSREERVPGRPLPAPGYDLLQLQVRHPGDVVEQVEVGYPTDAANTLVARCGLPPLEQYEGS